MNFKSSDFPRGIFFNSLSMQTSGTLTDQHSKELESWNSWKKLITEQVFTFLVSILLANWHAFYPLTEQSCVC